MKGRLIRNADRLAQEHTEAAINTIVNVMNDWRAKDYDRVTAANSLLDRGHGKPVAAVISIPASRQMQAALSAMSDADLEAEMLDAPLPRLISVDSPSRGTPTQRSKVSALHADSTTFDHDPLLD